MTDSPVDFILINVMSAQDFNRWHIGNFIHSLLNRTILARLAEVVAGVNEPRIVVYGDNLKSEVSTKATLRSDSAGFQPIDTYRGGAEEWHAASEVVH